MKFKFWKLSTVRMEYYTAYIRVGEYSGLRRKKTFRQLFSFFFLHYSKVYSKSDRYARPHYTKYFWLLVCLHGPISFVLLTIILIFPLNYSKVYLSSNSCAQIKMFLTTIVFFWSKKLVFPLYHSYLGRLDN